MLVAAVLSTGIPLNVVAQAPATWRLSADAEQRVGNELFTRVHSASLLAGDHLLVADQGELALFVFAPNGRLTARFGRRGDGPGEFRAISGVWVLPGDTIVTWDARALRITHFLPDGTVVRTTPVRGTPPVPGAHLEVHLGTISTGPVFLSWLTAEAVAEGKVMPDRLHFSIVGRSGELSSPFGEQSGVVRSKTSTGTGPLAFSPFPWAAVIGDTLVYTNGTGGQLHFFTPSAGFVRSVTLPVPVLSVSAAWAAFEHAARERGRPTPTLAFATATRHLVREVPTIGRIFGDDGGRLWVKEYDPAADPLPLRVSRYVTGGRWRIVASSGQLAATIELPPGIAPLAVKGDRVVVLVRDSLDVELVAVHKLSYPR